MVSSLERTKKLIPLKDPNRSSHYKSHWDGTQIKNTIRDLAVPQPIWESGQTVFVAHANAWPKHWDVNAPGPNHLLVSGTQTWFKLARLGLLVHGSAEGFGIDFARRFCSISIPV